MCFPAVVIPNTWIIAWNTFFGILSNSLDITFDIYFVCALNICITLSDIFSESLSM